VIGLVLQLTLLQLVDLAGEVIAVDEDDDVGFVGGERTHAGTQTKGADDERSDNTAHQAETSAGAVQAVDRRFSRAH